MNENDYESWKNWHSSNFGILSKNERAYFNAELKKVPPEFDAGSNVLEIGFGNGSFLKFCTEKSWNITGIEANKYLVDRANISGYHTYCKDNLESFADDSYDLVVAFDVLEHIKKEDFCQFFIQVKRVLRNNGILLIRFPNGDSPLSMCIQNADLTHVHAIGSGKIYFISKKLNFSIIHFGGSAEPLMGSSLKIIAYRLFVLPFKFIVNKLILLFLFPNHIKDFSSINLVSVLRVNK